MRFIVSGSAGFIGYRFCRQMLTLGHEVTGIDNHNSEYPVLLKEKRTTDLKTYPNFDFIKLNIENEAVKSILAGRKYDYAVHFAALDKIYEDLHNLRYSEYLNVNVVGTAKFMEVAKAAEVKKFIFASTHSIYGNTKKEKLSERKIVPNPVSSHGASKLAAEQVVKFISHQHDIPSVILRIFSVYGPDMRPHTFIPLAIKRILNNEPIDLYHNKLATRDYIYIDDVIEYVNACLNKRIKFQVLNIGTSTSYTLQKVAEEIAVSLGKDPRSINFVQHEKDFRKTVAENTQADVKRALKILKYSPKTSLSEGISKTVEWYLANPNNLDLSVQT